MVRAAAACERERPRAARVWLHMDGDGVGDRRHAGCSGGAVHADIGAGRGRARRDVVEALAFGVGLPVGPGALAVAPNPD